MEEETNKYNLYGYSIPDEGQTESTTEEVHNPYNLYGYKYKK